MGKATISLGIKLWKSTTACCYSYLLRKERELVAVDIAA